MGFSLVFFLVLLINVAFVVSQVQYKIGGMFPLGGEWTGSILQSGETWEALFRLTCDMINDGELGAYAGNIELVCLSADTVGGDTGEQARVNAQGLISQGVVGVVGAATSLATGWVVPLFNANEVPLISYASTASSLTDGHPYEYFLRTCAPDEFQAKALVEIIGSEYNWKDISIIAADDSYSAGLADAIESEALTYGITIRLRENVPQGSSVDSMDEELENIYESGARVIVLSMLPSDIEQLFVEIIRLDMVGEGWTYLGPDGTLLSLDTFSSNGEIETALQGYVATRPSSPILTAGSVFEKILTRWRLESETYPMAPTAYQSMPNFVGQLTESVLIFAKCLNDLTVSSTVNGTNLLYCLHSHNNVANGADFGITKKVYFDVEGNREPTYDVVNLVARVYEQVGTWDTENNLQLTMNDIVWPHGSIYPPSGTPIEVLKLGGIWPVGDFWGNTALLGLELEAAYKVACDYINTQTFMGEKIRLSCHRSFDSGASDGDVQTVTQTLIDEEVHVIIGPVTSTRAKVSALLSGQSGIVSISPSATNAGLSDMSTYPYFFRTVPPDNYQAEAACDMIEHFGWTQFAIISSDDVEAADIANAVENLCQARDINILTSRQVSQQATQSSILVEMKAIKDSGAAVIYCSAFTDLGLNIYQAAIDLDMIEGFTYIGPSGMVTYSSQTLGEHPHIEEAMFGFVGTHPTFGSGDLYFDFVNHWRKNFDSLKYPGAVHDSTVSLTVGYAAQTFDAVYVAAKAAYDIVNRGDTLTSEKIKTKLLSFNSRTNGYTGATGDVYFLANGDRDPNYDVLNLKGDEYSKIARWNEIDQFTTNGEGISTAIWHGGSTEIPLDYIVRDDKTPTETNEEITASSDGLIIAIVAIIAVAVFLLAALLVIIMKERQGTPIFYKQVQNN